MKIKRETAPADTRNVVQAGPCSRIPHDTSSATGKTDEPIATTSWSALRFEKASDVRIEATDLAANLFYLRTPATGEFWVDGRHVFAGRKPPQSLLVTNAARSKRVVLHDHVSVFQLYLPQALLQESYEHVVRRAPGTEIVLPDYEYPTDPTIQRLVQALVSAEPCDRGFGRVFLDSIGLAIASRLTANHLGLQCGPRSKGALATWRLNRVTDYVEAFLDTAITLETMATEAGLTRMHFATQFRASTGLSPHEYLLRRRIARAQELLLNPDLSIAGIALDVGFQTQAHFTVVFKRIVGETPGRWRKHLP